MFTIRSGMFKDRKRKENFRFFKNYYCSYVWNTKCFKRELLADFDLKKQLMTFNILILRKIKFYMFKFCWCCCCLNVRQSVVLILRFNVRMLYFFFNLHIWNEIDDRINKHEYNHFKNLKYNLVFASIKNIEWF